MHDNNFGLNNFWKLHFRHSDLLPLNAPVFG